MHFAAVKSARNSALPNCPASGRKGGYMTGGIITPPLLTLNMASTGSQVGSVNVNMKCHKTGKVFGTYEELKKHRIDHSPLDYVNGKPFFMLEVGFSSDEEFMYRCTEYFEGFQNDEEE